MGTTIGETVVSPYGLSAEASENGARLPLYVLDPDTDQESRQVIELVQEKGVSVRVLQVPDADVEDYINPRQVPMLITSNGMYVGFDTIEEVIERDGLAGTAPTA